MADVSPLYVDGVPLSTLTQAVASSQNNIAALRTDPANRFWSTPRRRLSDVTREVLEVNLNTTHLINSISLDLAHYPHTATIEWFDAFTEKWLPVLTVFNKATSIKITDSKPARINFKRAIGQPIGTVVGTDPKNGNPFHNGSDHWLSYDLQIQPVETSRLRVILNRGTGGIPPYDYQNRELFYPLAVRNLNVGYRVRDKSNIPYTPKSTTVPFEREAFTATTDMLGSSVLFNVRENLATDLLRGGQWKCEPQPVNYAVVPLYVDTRDPEGKAQVIDRFYLDPLYPNVNVNLYYSNDDPAIKSEANDQIIAFPAGQPFGAALPTPRTTGLGFPDEISYVQIDNNILLWDPANTPWWMGLVIRPFFDSLSEDSEGNSDGTVHYLFSASAITCYYANSTIYLVSGDTFVSVPVKFAANSAITLILNGGPGSLGLFVHDEGGYKFDVAPADNSRVNRPQFLRFAAEGGDEVGSHGNFELQGCVLNTSIIDEQTRYDFVAKPDSFLIKPKVATPGQDRTDGALLRFHPDFLTSYNGTNPIGFVGGPGNAYDGLVWTPINRDYKLRKGFFQIHPTKAKVWKFEFTNLSPQHFSSYVPINRKIKLYTQETLVSYRRMLAQVAGNIPSSGEKTQQNLTGSLRFYDFPSELRPPKIDTGYTATEALYAADPVVAARIRALNPMLGFENWRGDFTSPRFVQVTQHRYEEVEVRHNTKLAYFVGLKKLEVYRIDYTADDDTAAYVDLLHDDSNFEDGYTWSFAEGDLHTEDMALPPVAVSKTFSSTRQVQAIQFASRQSQPIQLLNDPDFSLRDTLGNIVLVYWDGVGDTTIEGSTDFNSDVGTTVKVSRQGEYNPHLPYYEVPTPNTATLTYGLMQKNFSSWSAIEDDTIDPEVPTYSDIQNYLVSIPQPPVLIEDEQPLVLGGITSTQAVRPSLSGRIHAAARIIAPNQLQAPLYLQIVGENASVDSDALAEIEINPLPGVVTEVYTGYNLGSGGVVSGNTYDDLEDHSLDDAGEDVYSHYLDYGGTLWANMANSFTPLNDKLTVRLVQKIETSDTWYVDTLSLYDNPIVWEFSRDGGRTYYPVFDIRNNPDGVFVFPPLPSDDTSNGRQLKFRITGYREDAHVNGFEIRPWYGNLLSGIPHREAIHAIGPNISPTDHYQPIEQDPWFKQWYKPIPEEWWFIYRQWLQIITENTVIQPTLILPPGIPLISQDYPFTPPPVAQPTVFMVDTLTDNVVASVFLPETAPITVVGYTALHGDQTLIGTQTYYLGDMFEV
jgi:hypothetical protein